MENTAIAMDGEYCDSKHWMENTAMKATGRPQEGQKKVTGSSPKATGFSPNHRTSVGKTRRRGNIILIIL